jgi:hypothetical protein
LTATIVTYTNVFSEPWNNVYSLINNKSNVADPTTISTEYRKWIYSREPDVKSIDFKGYPYIIINSAEQDIGKDKRSVDGKSKEVSWTIFVEVVTSDRGYNNNDGKGSIHCDAISDNIFETFCDMTIRKTLQNNNLYFSDPVANSMVVEPTNQELTYRRTFLLSFKTKMQVSA